LFTVWYNDINFNQTVNILNTLPALPAKEKLLSLLSKQVDGNPDWTPEEAKEVYEALRSLSFNCYRTEIFLETNND